MDEVFKDIENYEGLYKVTNQGRVYSLISKKFLKPQSDKGYLRVHLYKNNKQKNYKVHRLVANAFIPNPMNLPEVNHINEVKSDNRVSNLEWCSASYNCRYGARTARMMQHPNWKATREKCGTPKKAVLQFTKDGKFVAEYPSTIEAARQTSINQGNISNCCNGRKSYKSAGKYVWRYKEEEVA